MAFAGCTGGRAYTDADIAGTGRASTTGDCGVEFVEAAVDAINEELDLASAALELISAAVDSVRAAVDSTTAALGFVAVDFDCTAAEFDWSFVDCSLADNEFMSGDTVSRSGNRRSVGNSA